MALFTCSQCGHTQAVEDKKYIGKTATCPKCKTQGMVDLDAAFNQSAPIFVPVEDKKATVLHVTAGSLGIRCDSWADSGRLPAVRVRDMQPRKGCDFRWSWHLFSETDAAEYCASLAFISRVRLATGGVVIASSDFVVREARRLCERVTKVDLQPKMPRKDA
jgi:hypothetical protein